MFLSYIKILPAVRETSGQGQKRLLQGRATKYIALTIKNKIYLKKLQGKTEMSTYNKIKKKLQQITHEACTLIQLFLSTLPGFEQHDRSGLLKHELDVKYWNTSFAFHAIVLFEVPILKACFTFKIYISIKHSLIFYLHRQSSMIFQVFQT